MAAILNTEKETFPDAASEDAPTTLNKTNDIFRLEGHVIQTSKAQDFQYTGYTTSGNEFMVVCDGHGMNEIINCLKNLDWVDIMSSSNTPIETVKSILNTMEKNNSSRGSGSTITIMMVVNNPQPGIRVWWIGDSSCRVYENGNEIWRTTDHNSQSERERTMMKNSKFPEERSWDLNVLNKNTMTMKLSSYFNLGSYIPKQKNILKDEKINMTRALGHGGICCQDEETHFIPFDNALSPWVLRVIIGSDGLWDMICDEDNEFISSSETSATDLSTLALKRWSQEWNYICPVEKTTINNKKISSRDDIVCTIFQKLI